MKEWLKGIAILVVLVWALGSMAYSLGLAVFDVYHFVGNHIRVM